MNKMNGSNQEAFLNTEINRQLKEHNVPVMFPAHLAGLSEEDFEIEFRKDRKDFRNLSVMTIDSADCKDMDDAISLEVTSSGYILGVHIADVTAYVLPHSDLDQEALNRGTSIYLPSLTIPMLPEVLTNNLCSLVPGKDRNTISVLINLDMNANVTSYSVTKGVIRSRIKGVYSEINSIFECKASDYVKRRYAVVKEMLTKMKILSELLREKRMAEGANIQTNSVPKITIENSGILVWPKINKSAEIMVEEFMVLTNRLVSEFMIANCLPCIFRTQRIKNTKACYMSVANIHAELALDTYCHFTSPIRRYPDLLVHRALGYYLSGLSSAEIAALMDTETMNEVSEITTKRSRRAADIEYCIRRYCYAMYFSWHKREQFHGQVTGENNPNGQTLIKLDRYNLLVIGNAALKEYQGHRVSFYIDIDNRSYLKAHDIQLEVA
ncbi:MAG: RNB domain-containing ribonuclease [Butyrivibrio sp.]|nr:RNB domain-containing ribonuclease [Butyrivibrio sp.]